MRIPPLGIKSLLGSNPLKSELSLGSMSMDNDSRTHALGYRLHDITKTPAGKQVLSLSLSLYISMYIPIYVYICIYIYIYIYIYISLSLYIYIYISISLSLYISISLSLYIHIYLYTHTYHVNSRGADPGDACAIGVLVARIAFALLV